MRRCMKLRIQHPECRIQKVENAYGVEGAGGGTPLAATVTVAVPGKRRGPGGAGKRRPSGACNRYGKWSAGVLEYWEAEVGKGGWEAAKFTACYRIETRSYRLVRGFYRIATASCRLIWKFYHVLPGKSTQVVDFPHLAMASIFWGGAENNRILVRGMIVRGMGPRGNGQRRELHK